MKIKGIKLLGVFMLLTDISFIFYWSATLFHLIPESLLFNDYSNPNLIAWNWSFLPLDLLISATGITSIMLYKRECSKWKTIALCSLVLTFCSGLQAIAFWAIKQEFDPAWWIPNLFLMVYPLFFIKKLIR
ncbi:MAG: YvaD family protein [Clostridia bacterium]|nr:YvaD family protein [Clostridia bacterium]